MNLPMLAQEIVGTGGMEWPIGWSGRLRYQYACRGWLREAM